MWEPHPNLACSLATILGWGAVGGLEALEPELVIEGLTVNKESYGLSVVEPGT